MGQNMKPRLLILLIFITFTCSDTIFSYWHNLYDPDSAEWGTMTALNILGDSSNLYVCYNTTQKGIRMLRSSDLGKSWSLYYSDGDVNHYSKFKEFWGAEYPAPGYMYLLYVNDNFSDKPGRDESTSIKHFDERIGKVVDSITIEDTYGQTRLSSFSMFDSLNGVIYNCGLLTITRDGWKSFTQVDARDGWYDSETDTYHGLCYNLTIPKMLSPNKVFFKGSNIYNHDVPLNYGFYMLEIGEGDTTFTVSEIGPGINYEVSPDSIHFVTDSSELSNRLFPTSYCYINDSTWIYTGRGVRTGRGDCKTLELYKTDNGGKTYREVFNMDVDEFGLYGVDFMDEKHGVAVGNSVHLLTDDGGETWRFDTLLYKKDWTKFVPHYIWGVHISFVEDMIFLGTWNSGVFKHETEFGASVTDNQLNLSNSLIYPNPSHSGQKLNINYPGYLSGNVLVYDLYGKKILETDFLGNSFRLPKDISPGTYFAVISRGEEVILRDKFIVE